MASRSDSEDELVTPRLGHAAEESRMELGETSHGRLSVVLCHECHTVHYELQCHVTSPVVTAAKRMTGRESEHCRPHSITWDEFFGSSLELAPSLLSIYDNLAASSSNNDHDDDHASSTSISGSPQQDERRRDHGNLRHSHSCVTPAYPGFWVTDRDSHQRLFVRSCHLDSGGVVRPLSLMELPRESQAADRNKVKKRPLSISSLSSVSSTSLQRQQHKRSNLSHDADESCSDHTSHTSSDSNLTGAMSDRLSLISDRVSLTSDRMSMTSEPVSVTSEGVSVTSGEDSSVAMTTVPLKCAAGVSSDPEEAESSVDPGFFSRQQQTCPGSSALRVDVSCDGQREQLSPACRSSGLGSATSSSSSLSNLPAVPQRNSQSTAAANVHHNGSPPTSPVSPGGSSVDVVSRKQQPVVMKPLQTTIRPVVISLPESIRKPRSSSSSVDGERGAADPQTSWERGLAARRSSGGSGAPTVLSPGKTVLSSAGGCILSSHDTLSATCSASSLMTSEASSPSNGEIVEPRTSGVKSRSMGSSDVMSSISVSSASSVPLSPSATRTSSMRESLLPVLTSPVPTSPVLTSPVLTSPVLSQPQQVQQVTHQSWSSPLSPTALARRRFLASHFDLPDMAALEEPPNTPEIGDSSAEQPETATVSSSHKKEASVSTGRRSATLTVPLSLSFRNNKSDTSPMSSPSESSGSALHSPSGDLCKGPAEGSGAPSVSASVQSPPAFPHTSHHPLSPSQPGESTAHSPTSRSRSYKKPEGGSVSGRGGSVKGGSYVTYVQRVVTEIVETERMYVDSLEAIIKGYLDPLEQLLSNTPTGRDDLACLFCNIIDIYAFGKVFLSDLEQCALDPVKVADCFVRHNNGFVIYTDYCTNYPRAVEVLTRFMQDAELSEVCKVCQLSLGHGLPLGAYLLRPVQRILKYHLLLQNILKNFDKGRPGHGTLQQALGHMTDMAHHINEMKRRHEHAVRIQEVASQLEDYSGEDLTRLGELVLEGSFRVYGAKASRQVFMFEKGILISKKKEGGMLACKASIPCSNLMLVEVIPNEPLSFHIIPFDNPRHQHTLQARSMEQKRHWCQEIKRLILESYKGRIPDNVKSLVMELGRNHDNDYVGKDTHDSPWKHQHTAPEYLEKRRYRRKSGGKVPDFGPLLKLPKAGTKRDQVTGNKSKSPKAWRKSDSKWMTASRERSESLPVMLANASSASLPGIGASASLSSESVNRDNNQNKSSSSAVTKVDLASGEEEDLDRPESVQRRATSFKRAVRLQPLFSQDLTDLIRHDDDVPMVEDKNLRRKMEDMEVASGDRNFSKNGRQQQQVSNSGKAGTNGYGNCSSPSDGEDSSDTDCEERQRLMKHSEDPSKSLSMYSSMPALNSLERRPAQKRRPGETKTGLKTKKDMSKSSDSLANGGEKGDSAEPTSTRQYRRRWEGVDDGLQKKVPALHDTYGRRSRENLLRKKGKNTGMTSGARLTDWGSVDKLTHGSLSDLSHLKEDPWVKNPDSPSQSSYVSSRGTPNSVSRTPSTHSRSHSMSVMQSRDWNSAAVTPDHGRPRNNSDVTEAMRRSGKENLDWIVYVNRNSGDQYVRERASSLSRMTGRTRSSSGDLAPRALRDSNSSSNLTRSSSLCQDTLKRYSLDLKDTKKRYGEVQTSLTSPTTSTSVGERCSASTSEEKRRTHSVSVTLLTSSLNDDTEMTDITKTSNSHSPLPVHSGHPSSLAKPTFTRAASQPPQSPPRLAETLQDSFQAVSSPPTPRPRSGLHHLLSPTPFPSRHQDKAQIMTPHSMSPQFTSATQCVSPQTTPTLSPRHSEGAQPAGERQSNVSPLERLSEATCPRQSRLQRPLSPKTAALSAEGERIVAEMEKYYEVNSPKTPTLTFKFPSTTDSSHVQSSHQVHHEADNIGANTLSINRLSGVSSVSSTDSCTGHHHLNTPRDVNPNRLSGVSSISTSSYESQNSNSSDSLVGTLKNKLSVWTHKLGGKRSREEDLALSASQDGLASPTALKSQSELQDVLREHSLGSPLIGSRMANTLPVGFETLLSPSGASPDRALSSYEFSSKEGTPESQRFSFPCAVPKQNKSMLEAFPASADVQQSDSGISMYSGEPNDTRSPPHKSRTLPANITSLQQFADGAHLDSYKKKRRDSGSSTASGDSFYERRLSVAFDSGVFQDQGISNQQGEPQSPGGSKVTSRRSIREVVQYIEEKFRPRQPAPVEVRRKEPSALIRQRLQSLRDNASYKRRLSSRSVSEDRGRRTRDKTPESPQLPRPNRSRSGNQFMHRVHPVPVVSLDTAEAEREREREMAAKRERELAAKREREIAAKREREMAEKEREMAARATERGRESEERTEDAGSSGMSGMGSMDRLNQLSTDVDNLVIMRGWVRSLINKFQQIT